MSLDMFLRVYVDVDGDAYLHIAWGHIDRTLCTGLESRRIHPFHHSPEDISLLPQCVYTYQYRCSYRHSCVSVREGMYAVNRILSSPDMCIFV